MFACLKIYLDRDIKKDKQKHDSLITIEDIRNNILRLTDTEPEFVKNIINNKKNTMPYIIYSRPYKNQIRIFALTENGKLALNSIFVNLINTGTLKIKDEIYTIKDKPVIDDNISFLPQKASMPVEYTTLTPINIFNKYNMKVFDAIAGRHFGKKRIKDGTLEEKDAFYKDIQGYALVQIKQHIKYMLSNLIEGKRIEDFEFVENIEINWIAFDVFYKKYHSEEKTIPMVVGRFKSNFVLPKFVGYKIGKGFGELSQKSKG